MDITFVLTGLLSELPREKGNRAHCLVETTRIPNNSSWRGRAFPWITIVLIFWRWFLHEPPAYAADNSFPLMVVRWIGHSKYSGKWMWMNRLKENILKTRSALAQLKVGGDGKSLGGWACPLLLGQSLELNLSTLGIPWAWASVSERRLGKSIYTSATDHSTWFPFPVKPKPGITKVIF